MKTTKIEIILKKIYNVVFRNIYCTHLFIFVFQPLKNFLHL